LPTLIVVRAAGALFAGKELLGGRVPHPCG